MKAEVIVNEPQTEVMQRGPVSEWPRGMYFRDYGYMVEYIVRDFRTYRVTIDRRADTTTLDPLDGGHTVCDFRRCLPGTTVTVRFTAQ